MSKRKASDKTGLAPIFQKKVKTVVPCDDGAKKTWKMVCWNVAGLRACVKKSDFKEIIAEQPDIVFLGETKCNEWPPVVEEKFPDYKKTLVISTAKNGGYAGVGLLSKVAPIKVTQGIGDTEFDAEGRLIIAEFANFYFIGVYVPNSGRGLVTLPKREKWEKLFLEKIRKLDTEKPVVYAGDLNVAHNEIDLANPDANRNKTAGFTDQERGWFTDLLAHGFKDTFREMHPEDKSYTFWTYMANARSRNVGWRLDYFVVSNRIMENVKRSGIMSDVQGSDHAPIIAEIEL